MRNEEICQAYLEGATVRELAARYEITAGWVAHILRRNGISIMPATKTDRVAFTGVLLSKPVKDALKVIVKQEGTSMSKYIAGLVRRELKECGVVLITSTEEEPALPYEAPDPDIHG